MNDLAEKFKNICKNKKAVNAAVAVGIAGMALILISGFFGEDKNNSECVSSGYADIFDTHLMDEYAEKKQNELKNLLESIEGVGKVKVMLNVICTEEYVYASEKDVSQKHDSGGSSAFESSSSYFVKDSDGEPLMTKVISPQIGSCVVACEGAHNAIVRESVYLTVSAVLDIPIGNIYVAVLE